MGEVIVQNRLIEYASISIKNVLFTFTAFIFSFNFLAIKDIYVHNQYNLISSFIDLIKLYPFAVILIIISFLFYAIVLKKKNKVIRFAFLFIFITALPYVWLAGYERYFYLPSLGFVLIFSEYFVNSFSKSRPIKLFIISIIVLFITYNIYFISVRKFNWEISAQVTYKSLNEIRKVSSGLPDSSHVFFRNLPDNYNTAWIFRDGVQYFPSLFLNRPDLTFKKIYEEDVHSDLKKNVYVFDYYPDKFVLEQ
jgi:hypothetical protein